MPDEIKHPQDRAHFWERPLPAFPKPVYRGMGEQTEVRTVSSAEALAVALADGFRVDR